MPNAPSQEIIRAGLDSTGPFKEVGLLIQKTHPEFDPNELYPMPGEDYAAWYSRLNSLRQKYPDLQDELGAFSSLMQEKTAKTGQILDKTKVRMSLLGANGGAGPGGMNGSAGAGPLDRNKAIDDFYRMMMDPNAPELVAAQRQAEAGMSRRQGGMGIGGGMGASATARAGIQTRQAMQFARQQAGIGALQYGMTHDLQKSGQTFDQNQSNQLNNQAQINGYIQGGIAAAGQLGSAALQAYGAGQGATGGGVSGYGMNGSAYGAPYGGAGNYNPYSGYYGSNPSEWQNPYGGY